MRFVKLQFKNEIDSSRACAELRAERVKCTRLKRAVIALSNMHNTNTITNIMVDNKGYGVEPSSDDIDALNKE